MADGWNIVTSVDNMRLASGFDVMMELNTALYERLAGQALGGVPVVFNNYSLHLENMKRAISDFEYNFQPNAYHLSIWAGYMNPDKEQYIKDVDIGSVPETQVDYTVEEIKAKLGITDLIPAPDRFNGEHFRAWAYERKRILDLLKWVALLKPYQYNYRGSYNALWRYTDRASIMYNRKTVQGLSWEQAEANFASSPWVAYTGATPGIPSLQQIQYQYQIDFYWYGEGWANGQPPYHFIKDMREYIDNKFRFRIPAKVELYAMQTNNNNNPGVKHGDLLINQDEWYKVRDLPDTATTNTVIDYPGKEYYDITPQPDPVLTSSSHSIVSYRYVIKYDGPNGFKFKNW